MFFLNNICLNRYFSFLFQEICDIKRFHYYYPKEKRNEFSMHCTSQEDQMRKILGGIVENRLVTMCLFTLKGLMDALVQHLLEMNRISTRGVN